MIGEKHIGIIKSTIAAFAVYVQIKSLPLTSELDASHCCFVFAWLMVALSVLKMPGFLACIITVIITAFESICIWQFSSVNMLTAALEGALNALWPICLVIVAALYTYVLTLEIG